MRVTVGAAIKRKSKNKNSGELVIHTTVGQ